MSPVRISYRLGCCGPRSGCCGATIGRRQREEPLLSRVGLFDITRETHTVAESIERHIKTLDALHLATAVLVGASVTVATHEVSMRVVAEHLGLDTVAPVASS